MSEHATDETDPASNEEADPANNEETDRYAELTIGDDEFVIYDRQNHEAWIQSTVAVTEDDLQ